MAVRSTWPQGSGVLSLLVPPERFLAFLAAPPNARRSSVLGGLRCLYGEQALEPQAVLERMWGQRSLHPGPHRQLGAR